MAFFYTEKRKSSIKIMLLVSLPGYNTDARLYLPFSITHAPAATDQYSLVNTISAAT